MSSTIRSHLEFSFIRAAEISKYRELRVRITVDGSVQESLESTLDAGVHAWREPFSFTATSASLCQIHVLAKKRNFLCYAGIFKAVRTTRLQRLGELLDTRSSDGAIRLPLYDSTKTDAHGAAMGSVEFLIVDMSVTKDHPRYLSARENVPYREESCASSSLRSLYPEAIPEELSLAESDSEVPMSPPPRPKAPTPPASPPSLSPMVCPPNIPPQPPLMPPDVLTPQYLQTTTQLPQSPFAYSPQKSGVDRISPVDTHVDAIVHPKYVPSPGIPSDGTMTAVPSLIDEGKLPGLVPQGSAEIGTFTPVVCEPPEDIALEGTSPWFLVPQETTEPTSLFTTSEGLEYGIIPQISITLAKSSRGNSPLAPSTCESDTTTKRPSVHVDTGSATQTNGVTSAQSKYPGVDEPSPFSRSAVLGSPEPTTGTTNTSGLSPFSRTSIVESPSTMATTPAQSAVSDGHKNALASAPECNLKRKERPTIDTSVVGPRGQVRKYRNGSVPPVHVPVKLRNASLDLPRPHEYEKFEPNPSMYSIAPSISPRRVKRSGDLRCPSSQPPASRQGLTRTRAPSIRREALEYDEAQICLDTANLGDQEVATFLKEVDAALSAIVNGSPAVAADSHAFLAVPGTTSRLVSRHQSRRPSSQHLRADLSATVRSHEREFAARTGFSLVATSHPSLHPDVVPSRLAPPLSGHADAVPRLFLSQLDTTAGSRPGSPARPAAFALPQRVSPQPSPRQELVEWVSPPFASSVSVRTREHPQLSRPGSYYGDANGNEKTAEAV